MSNYYDYESLRQLKAINQQLKEITKLLDERLPRPPMQVIGEPQPPVEDEVEYPEIDCSRDGIYEP